LRVFFFPALRRAVSAAVVLAFFTVSGAAAMPAPPQVSAPAAIVIEASTGKVLYAKNPYARHYPASTTKILTLLVALEQGDLNDVVEVSPRAAATEGSSLGLAAGDRIRLGDLLWGMIMLSGNDAAVAVAEHIGGSVWGFARLMNEKARQIGLTGSHFVNPNGLPDPNHYTTAADLAKLAAYGYKNPLFAAIVSAKFKTIPWREQPKGRTLESVNHLLWTYEGANGVKTGHTEAAGYTLVAGAKRDGVQLIAVVLGCRSDDDREADITKLLDYGYQRAVPYVLYEPGAVVKSVRVKGGPGLVPLTVDRFVAVPYFEGETAQFETVVEAPAELAAPPAPGTKVGVLRLVYQGRVLDVRDLVAGRAAPGR